MSNEHPQRHGALAFARCLAALLGALPLCLALWSCDETAKTPPEPELDQSEVTDTPVEIPEQELDETELPCTEGAVRDPEPWGSLCCLYETCIDGVWVPVHCDCPEPMPHACTANVDEQVVTLPVQFGLSAIALPKSFALVQIPEGRGALFEDREAGLFGFATAAPSQSCCLAPDDNSRFASVALGPNGVANDEDDNVPQIGLAQSFQAPLDWDAPSAFPFEPVQSTRFELLFEYGEQSANPHSSGRDAAGLRDALFHAISGTAVSSEDSAPCARLQVWWLEQWRYDPWIADRPGGEPLLLSTVLVACEQPPLSAGTQRLVEDVFSGTHTAPGNYTTARGYGLYFCKRVLQEPSGESVLRVPVEFYPIAGTLHVAASARFLEWSREWHYDPLRNELVIDLSGLNDAERKDLAYSGLQWGELPAG